MEALGLAKPSRRAALDSSGLSHSLRFQTPAAALNGAFLSRSSRPIKVNLRKLLLTMLFRESIVYLVNDPLVQTHACPDGLIEICCTRKGIVRQSVYSVNFSSLTGRNRDRPDFTQENQLLVRFPSPIQRFTLPVTILLCTC